MWNCRRMRAASSRRVSGWVVITGRVITPETVEGVTIGVLGEIRRESGGIRGASSPLDERKVGASVGQARFTGPSNVRSRLNRTMIDSPATSSASAGDRKPSRIRSALHLPSRRATPAATSAAPTPSDTVEIVRELLNELRRERREVLEPLLRRMSALGQSLSAGRAVPADTLRSGLEIWQKYVDRMLDVHVGQFTVARSSLSHTEECRLSLAQLEDEPGQSAGRVNEIRTLLDGYAIRPQSYIRLLGNVLVGLATSELAWADFEEDFANSCLPLHLPESAVAKWKTSLEEARAQAGELREKLQAFLDQSKPYAWPEWPASQRPRH